MLASKSSKTREETVTDLHQQLQDIKARLQHELVERKRAEEALIESEAKYCALVENETDAVMLIDAETLKFEDVNKAGLELFGYTKDEFLSLTLQDISGEKQKIRIVVQNLKTEEPRKIQIPLRRFKKRNGVTFSGELVSGSYTAGGRIKIIGVVRDITERKQLEAQLLEVQKMEAVGSLVAGVAHEINNPINTIIMNAPLLERIWHDLEPVMAQHAAGEPDKKYGGLTHDFLKENLAQLILDVDAAANRVAGIVRKLKDFSRKSVAYGKEPLKINTAAENAIHLAQTTLRKSNVVLESRFDENIPLMEGNLRNLEQIILNLIINGYQAIDHEEGKVTIRTGLEKQAGRIYLSVSDNGRGIDPSMAKKLFNPFVTDRQSEGKVGLGLSVTYNLVKAHNGEITFDSRKDGGTIFTVRFPFTLRRKAAKILIVEDDDQIREAVAQALSQNRDYILEMAKNGTEALVKLGTFNPDLIILDLLMPGLNGVEVCRALMTTPELTDVKVIIMTGYSKRPELGQIVDMGFTTIIEKPFEFEKLYKTVGQILKK